LNIGYNPGSLARTINTSFAAGTHLVELTGNWQDPSGTIPQTVTVASGGPSRSTSRGITPAMPTRAM